jgi:hypothetical protein
MTSTVLLKRGKNDGIAVYIPKETILKEKAAKIKCGIFSIAPHTLFLNTVCHNTNTCTYMYLKDNGAIKHVVLSA